MNGIQIRVRVPKELADEVKRLVAEIDAKVPEAGVTVSSVTRYALQYYVDLIKSQNQKGDERK